MYNKDNYRNPLVYNRADPFCYLHTDGYYYFTATEPYYEFIELRRAKSLNELVNAETRVVWRKHEKGDMGAHIWAPEIHYIDGVWYIYFTAGHSDNKWNIRPYALVCRDKDPMAGTWEEAGRIDVGHESFSLDMTSFVHNDKQYVLWAQVMDEEHPSSVYIARMKNPLELETKPMLLTKPQYDWELRGIPVNEGPSVLIRNGKIMVVYSAANTGSNYCMGLLWCDENADVMDISSWHKMSEPIMQSSDDIKEYGPGHNSFTTDGENDIIVYHSRSYKNIIGDPLDDINRHTRARKIVYDDNGLITIEI